MNKTRRGFLKFLGKAAVVGVGIAVAPKTVLGFKPQEKLKFKDEYDAQGYFVRSYEIAPRKGDIVKINKPMTATEVIARQEEFNSVNSQFIKAYGEEVMKAFSQRGAVLKNLK